MGGTGQSAGVGRTSGRPRGIIGSARPQPTGRVTTPPPQAPVRASNGDVSVGDTANFGNNAATITDANFASLRRAMGQTGEEAGHLGNKLDRTYIGTGRSYNINQYLRTDGKEYKTDQSKFWNNRITPEQIRRDIHKIDAGMRGLPQDTMLFRFERGDMLGGALAQAGLPGYDRNNIGSLIASLKNDPSKLQTFSNILKGMQYTNKGYSSLTYEGSHPGFGAYDVQFRIVARAGTNAIATINTKEHEVLGGHHLGYTFTGGVQIKHRTGYVTDFKTMRRTKFDKDQIILDVYLDNTPATTKRVK